MTSTLPANPSHKQPLIWILDDDPQVGASLSWLLSTINLSSQTYTQASTLLEQPLDQQPGCLLLDVRMPQISGLEVLKQLRQRHILLPALLLSGHADVDMAVQAMKLGALDFFEKPFNDQKLLDSLHLAIQQHRHQLDQQHQRAQIAARLASLTTRERQIMQLLVAGLAVKKIANQLGISSKTVDVHRYNLMQKMQAASLVELAQIDFLLHPPANPIATISADSSLHQN